MDIHQLLKRHLTALEYTEHNHILSPKYFETLRTGEKNTVAFLQIYQRYMTKELAKQQTLNRLRYQYLANPSILATIDDELKSLSQRLEVDFFRQSPCKQLVENNHSWRNILPWVKNQLSQLDAIPRETRPRRYSQRRKALLKAQHAICSEFASQADVKKILKMADPIPKKESGELTVKQAFHWVILNIRELIHRQGRKGSPRDIIQFIKRHQIRREHHQEDPRVETLECSGLGFCEKEQKIFFINEYGERVTYSPTTLNRIIYTKRLPIAVAK